MFNLLVKAGGWEEKTDWLPAERVFEHTAESLGGKFKPKGQLATSLLQELPTLFVPEVGSDTVQLGRIGRIVNFRASLNRIGFDYALDTSANPVPVSEIERLSSQLDIGRFELNRTHWAIKDVDVHRALAPAPRDDTLEDWEMEAAVAGAYENDDGGVLSARMADAAETDALISEAQLVAETAQLEVGQQTVLSKWSATLARNDPKSFETVVEDVIRRMRQIEDSRHLYPPAICEHAGAAAASLQIVLSSASGVYPAFERKSPERSTALLLVELAGLYVTHAVPEAALVVQAGVLILRYMRPGNM